MSINSNLIMFLLLITSHQQARARISLPYLISLSTITVLDEYENNESTLWFLPTAPVAIEHPVRSITSARRFTTSVRIFSSCPMSMISISQLLRYGDWLITYLLFRIVMEQVSQFKSTGWFARYCKKSTVYI